MWKVSACVHTWTKGILLILTTYDGYYKTTGDHITKVTSISRLYFSAEASTVQMCSVCGAMMICNEAQYTFLTVVTRN